MTSNPPPSSQNQTKSPPGRSFLWLRPSTSSNLGRGDLRSSWTTTTDSGNSESILPMSTVTNENQSHAPGTLSNSSSRQGLSSNSNPLARPTQKRPLNPPVSYPPPSNSSLAPSPNAHHNRSLTASTTNSSQDGGAGSTQSHAPRAHPYQLAAYDSYNYRGSKNIPESPQDEQVQSANGSPAHLSATRSLEKSSVNTYEKQTLSPTTPNATLPTNTLLSDVDGRGRQQGGDERRPKRARRQSMATLASLRILNNYHVPPVPAGGIAPPINFRAPSDPRSAVLSAVIIGSVLALPLALSVVYISVGHVVLRAATPSTRFGAPSIYAVSTLQSSVQAAATGGGILAIPILLLLYVIGLFPSGSSPQNPEDQSQGNRQAAGEDFFEDYSDTDSTKNPCSKKRILSALAYTLCVLLAVSVGGIAASLGVTILSSSDLDLPGPPGTPRKIFLSPAQAAAAGLVGGSITLGGIALLLGIAFVLLLIMVRVQHGPPLER